MAAEGWTPERVRSVLVGESPGLASQRRVFRRIPSPPRCKLCAAPFAAWAASSSGMPGTGNPPATQLSAQDA
jgi:adenylate cyclase